MDPVDTPDEGTAPLDDYALVRYDNATDLVAYNVGLDPPSPGRTLLPASIANVVSFATRSTSFALRLGTFVGGFGLSAAKFTTLSSLELGRGILEGILSRAGKDALVNARSEMGKADAETVLERSLEALHQTMTQVVFWTTTGFHITGTTMSTASHMSQLFLSVLDQFFGSTDSSKAIASIITLIRREFRNPATGTLGETVGVVDLVLGLCGLAYLQSWCQRMIQEDSRRLCLEEVVWDIVVLNDSLRADTDDSGTSGARSPKNAGVLDTIEQHGALAYSSDDNDESHEYQLKQHILDSLPEGARVSISTSTTITKTITAEIKGASTLPAISAPGLDLVESEISDTGFSATQRQDTTPTYKVVYRLSRNKVRSTAANDGINDGTEEDSDDDYLETKAHPRVEMLDERRPSSSRSQGIDLESEMAPEVPPKDDRIPHPTPPPSHRRRFTNESGPAKSRSRSSGGSAIGSGNNSSRERTSQIPVLKPGMETTANQKRARQPLDESHPGQTSQSTIADSINRLSSPRRRTSGSDGTRPAEKKSGLRNVLKKGPVPGISNLLSRDSSNEFLDSTTKPKSSSKPPWGSHKPSQAKSSASPTQGHTPNRNPGLVASREAPQAPQRGNPNYFSSRDLGSMESRSGTHRNLPRPGLASRARPNSLISQTDSISVHSYESRPSSPVLSRPGGRTPAGNRPDSAHPDHKTHGRGHARNKSLVPSLYSPSIHTLKTADSQTSLVLPSFQQRSAYSNSEAVDELRRTGAVEGIFPDYHILRNISRYSRYASAAYGSHFLRLMGITKELPVIKALDETHQDVRFFAHHAELPPDSILLSSFVDPQGGSDSTGATDTGIPLVHTISLDEESKAVVLSCRGTLGFEDVLVDMMCDYDDLFWRGRSYQVHKGIHASARRLLYGGDGRVLITLKETLEEFPEYGLVLCGHSLGGAVTALLGVMLAEPAPSGSSFVTSAHQHRQLLTEGYDSEANSHVCLPSGRPIHVYAYGPPASMTPSLQRATRGLITSTVHGNDIVPYLSIGVLHDFQAVALAFKTDNNEAKAEVRRRIWEGLQSGLADRWYNNATKSSTDEQSQWAYAALKTLRATMMSTKLLPPGEVFTIESTPALRRDPYRHASSGHVGRPATRVVLKYVRDVEARFREVRFGASMLTDHSPGRYEDALRRITLGVLNA